MPTPRLLTAFTALGVLFLSTAALAQVTKPRLAIQEIAATDAVLAQANRDGQANVLEQILQGSDSQLANTVNQTKRFDIVARSKYRQILKEQAIGDSGDVNPGDPQIARAFLMAGAKFVATVTIDNYQDITAKAHFEGGFGTSAAERRTIQLQATLQIFDTTTAVMLESASITLEESETNEILPGSREQGRATNALIGRVTKKFATEAAILIMNRLVPAKVIAYTMGNITFNRGQGTGVEVGQFWQVFHPGEDMIDPDTGESLGAEEIPLGWAQVTQVLPKFSKAVAMEDFGIDRGNIMRHSTSGLPATVDPNGRGSGSATSRGTGRSGVAGSGGVPPRQQPPRSTPQQQSQQPIQQAVPQGGSKPLKLALFVRDVSPDVPDQKVMVLESYITAALTSPQIELINRAELLNALSDFSTEGSNRGTGDPIETAAQRLLSDHSSAVALARNLMADGLIIATITSLDEDRREVNDPQRGTYVNQFYTLDVTWNVLDGGTGGSLASGLAQAREGVRQYENQTRTFSMDSLLRDDARQIGEAVRRAMANPSTRRPTAQGKDIGIQIRISLADMSVPEIRKQDDGSYVIAANRYQLEPLACNVIVDGMLAGTAPGVIQMTPGPHRIRIERPMIESIDRFMVVRPGQTLTIPVKFSQEGRRQWMEQTAFFENLKDGAALREGELEKAKAFAQFLRQSRMNLDTSSLDALSVGSQNIWSQWIEISDE